jgi:putative ABC transport system permease protein
MTISPSGDASVVRNETYDRILERLQGLPSVRAVGAIDTLFQLGALENHGLRAIEGRNPEPRERWTPLTWNVIRGDYLQAMGAPLLMGRYFSAQDGPNTPLVAIIDESMARRYWPGENPIGKRFKGGDPRGQNDDWIAVVGVTRDMRRSGLETNPIPHIYLWHRQEEEVPRTEDFVLRTTDDSTVALRGAVREIDHGAIVSSPETLGQKLSEQLMARRFQTWLLSIFSSLAMLLAAVGIFGVMHHSVAQRTHEIGIRLALGAQHGDVMRLVIGEGARLALFGVAIGTFAAFALTRLMSGLLFGVGATDPVTFISVVFVLTIVGLMACYLPARRAMHVDPVVALRYD